MLIEVSTLLSRKQRTCVEALNDQPHPTINEMVKQIKLDDAINIAIDNVIKEGLNDIFVRPFEIELLKRPEFRGLILDSVRTRIKSNSLESLKVKPISHVLVPKKKPFDFRRAALIEPIDTILYLALAIQAAPFIEKGQPPKKNRVVYSYRFKTHEGAIFDKKFNFTSFLDNVKKKTNRPDVKILVKCDIASFYDRLNLHRLESSLHSLGVEKQLVKLINQLLLFWANRDSYGLPIGSNASRILAEASLIPVDNYLLEREISFCRFVDDYRIFAPNQQKAHLWLTLLIERLQKEGLQINPAKTLLKDVSIKHPTLSSTNEDPKLSREENAFNVDSKSKNEKQQ